MSAAGSSVLKNNQVQTLIQAFPLSSGFCPLQLKKISS